MKCKCKLINRTKGSCGIISTSYQECDYCKRLRREYAENYHSNLGQQIEDTSKEKKK